MALSQRSSPRRLWGRSLRIAVVVPAGLLLAGLFAGEESPLVWLALPALALVALWLVLFVVWDRRDRPTGPVVPLALSAPEAGERFTFRRRWASATALVWPALLLATALVFVVGVPVWPLVVPWALAAAVVAWRATRIALELDGETVVIRNLLRTHVVPWSDVSGITLGDEFGGKTLHFVRRRGRLAIAALATADSHLDPGLVRQLRRYAEPHGVEFADELLRV